MKDPGLPQRYTYYLFSPILPLLLSLLFTGGPGASLQNKVVALLAFFSFILLIITYVVQIRYIHRFFPSKKFRPQFLLLIFAILAPTVASFMGDYGGSARFSDEPSGALSDLAIGFALGGVIAIAFLYIFAWGNLFYIGTKGLNRGYEIISGIIYSLGWLSLAIASYFIYSILYSLHDPSTE